MKKWQRQFLNWLAVILWLGVIYYFSSQPELKSQLEPFIDLICRKIAHMAEFFVLAYLFFRALLIDLNFKKALIISVILSILSAFFDTSLVKKR